MKLVVTIPALFAAALVTAVSAQEVIEESRFDFDGDGQEEKLISRPGSDVIVIWNSNSESWEPANFALPDSVMRFDEQGEDAGLRFVDLNGDGFHDVLFSNQDRYGIHLWTREIQPHLGWIKGWSQTIRTGERQGKASEPPVIAGREVEVVDGELIVYSRGNDQPRSINSRHQLEDLIAYETPLPLSPEESLDSFQVPSGFQVEQVASEPLVMDPVAFDWDAEGRLWVVEMGDYPLGPDGQGGPGGRVRVLEDENGDGRYDTSTILLEEVPYPTGVMPWRNGALISAAPDVFYVEDTDGDGKVDRQEVLLTGFNPGNQQHRVNGFEWGLDDWVYIANGDSGGVVRSLKTGQELDIRGRDVRFKPDTGELETVSKQTQFGRRRDDWGNWFGNNNPTWLWHVTLPERYLRRNPRLAVRQVSKVLANYDNSTRVHPISKAMVRPNQPWSLNHVTSACSPSPYRDSLFGESFATSVFISEPVHNAVHREVLIQEGTGFISRRAPEEQDREFLASTDNWFRPTTLRTGPDGALYVADMYRLVIEHPEWISQEMQSRLDLRAGTDLGRIYRVAPVGAERRPIPNLAELDDTALAEAMNSDSGWQRDTVQRLLHERNATGTALVLADLTSATYPPQVRLQAFSTLGMLGVLEASVVIRCLQDPHPEVRRGALRQSESFSGEETVFNAVARLVNDRDPRVRLQLAFSLGAWPERKTAALLKTLIAGTEPSDLMRIAALSSMRPDGELFRQFNVDEPVPVAVSTGLELSPSSADRAQVIAGYNGVETLTGDPEKGRLYFQTLCAICHRMGEEGYEVGPDLGTVKAKPADWLVAAILDPNQAVEATYRGWNVMLKSGEELSGLITTESANNIVLRMAGGVGQVVFRDDIQSMHPMSVSLMPAGFESALNPQAMADLLSWLRNHN